MDSLEALTRKIAATGDLKSLVRSMKRLSAAGMYQLEHAEAALRRFRRTIDLGLQVVLMEHPIRPAVGGSAQGLHVVVAFGSDRGLCGAFNETVAELTRRHVERVRTDHPHQHVIAVGRLAADHLRARDVVPHDVLQPAGSVPGLGEACERILIRLDALQQTAAVHSVATIFNHRDDEGEIHPSAHVLLPIALDHLRGLARARWPSRRLPAYSVHHEQMFRWLVRQHLLADLHHAGLSSMAAENAARLAAMQRAERAIDDMYEEMTADHRRLRQEAITSELMDIVGGFEALRQQDA